MAAVLWHSGHVTGVSEFPAPVAPRLRADLRVVLAIAISVVLHLALAGWLSDILLFGRQAPQNQTSERLQVGLQSGRAAPSNVPAPDLAPVALLPISTEPSSGPAVESNSIAVPAPGAGNDEIPARERGARRPQAVSPFLPPEQVEIQAEPLSPPDLNPIRLLVKTYSGSPIRLRLFVDASGKIVNVKILHAQDMDEEAATILVQVWERVPFLPARREGQSVASFQDVEFQLADRKGVPLIRSLITLPGT